MSHRQLTEGVRGCCTVLRAKQNCQALILSGNKKGSDPDILVPDGTIADLTGAMHTSARPMHPHARAFNRRSPYLRTLQTLRQPRYATHLLKPLWSVGAGAVLVVGQ